MILLEVFIPGIPRPGGSKKAWVFTPKGGGKPRAALQDASGDNGKNWRASVLSVVAAAWQRPPVACALQVDFHFTMPRPKAHRTSKGLLKPTAPRWHTSRPDRTKLIRSAEDALKGVLWTDDCLIVDGHSTKQYGDRPGLAITVSEAL